MFCPEKSGLLHENFLLFERCPEKCFQFVERNDIGTVVQVRMVCTGNDHQFLVVAFQLFERVFAEIAGMGLFSMNEKYGAADFVDVIGMFMKESEDVLFHPLLELSERL